MQVVNSKISAAHPIELGASLYVPATRSDLAAIGQGRQIPNLRSVIYCCEDSIKETDVPLALQNLKAALGFFEHPMLRFARPRHPAMLEKMLQLPLIERLNGFVLPKVTASNLADYLKVIRHSSSGFGFQYMITLETKEAFSVQQMEHLRDLLLASELPVLSIRIGGNDLLNLLSLRRQRGVVAYETPLGLVIQQLVSVFKPYGFSVAAPVYDFTDDPETLISEALLDVQHGLVGKTAIHPRQIALIEAAYQVRAEDVIAARAILEPDAPAVFRIGDQMCEPATHREWAKSILNQARIYGELPTRNNASLEEQNA
jgi:citrate lyase beta subunit